MKNLAYFFIVAISTVIVLIYGRSILIPFVFAVLLWFIVRKVRQMLDKVGFIRDKVPSWIKSVLTTAIMILLFSMISKILLENIQTLAQSYPAYESNLSLIFDEINRVFKVNVMAEFKDFSAQFNFGGLLAGVFKSLTDILSNAFLIIIYMMFIFLEETSFKNKLRIVLKHYNRDESVIDLFGQIENSVSNYIGIKSMISLTTGILSSIALYLIGIDSPIFWGFLIFLLNFIPTIGSLVATLFPAVFCLLQFGEVLPSVLVLGIVGGIQVFIGNVLEPKIMGSSLNLSPLVAILSLVFWGAIWGITGMLLCVPFTVIMVIVFSHFERTKPVAVMLSENGVIKTN